MTSKHISSVRAIVTRTLAGYSPRPQVTYGTDGNFTVFLRGGPSQARDDVERALEKHIDSVQNFPERKTIRTVYPYH
jgi:hypothetical protein